MSFDPYSVVIGTKVDTWDMSENQLIDAHNKLERRKLRLSSSNYIEYDVEKARADYDAAAAFLEVDYMALHHYYPRGRP
jgi:hypothetical protein